MKTIDAKNLPSPILLSHLTTTPNQAIKVINLTDKKELIIDISLDGEVNGKYVFPDKPITSEWYSEVTKREAVHTALLHIDKSNDFTVTFNPNCGLYNSRGRGFVVTNSSDFKVYYPFVHGCRSAGIALEDCTFFFIYDPVSFDTGNYQTAKGQGKNWPGSIKLKGCNRFIVYNPVSGNHVGNGITATECTDGKFLNPITVNVDGANIYVNASENHLVSGALVLNCNNGIVINSEKENEKPSNGFTIVDCVGINVITSIGVWGNEGEIQPIDKGTITNNFFICTNQDIKFSPNSPITDLVMRDNHFVDPKLLPDSLNGGLRSLIKRLNNLIPQLVTQDDKVVKEFTTLYYSLCKSVTGLFGPKPITKEELLNIISIIQNTVAIHESAQSESFAMMVNNITIIKEQLQSLKLLVEKMDTGKVTDKG